MNKNINFSFQKSLSRRTVLKGLGAGMALPLLSAMTPAFAAPEKSTAPRRFLGLPLWMLPNGGWR